MLFLWQMYVFFELRTEFYKCGQWTVIIYDYRTTVDLSWIFVR